MTDTTEVRDKVRAFLSVRCHVPVETINGDTRIEEDLGLDSFDLIELLIEVEEAYGVVITDADAAELETVEQAAEHIAARRR